MESSPSNIHHKNPSTKGMHQPTKFHIRMGRGRGEGGNSILGWALSQVIPAMIPADFGAKWAMPDFGAKWAMPGGDVCKVT